MIALGHVNNIYMNGLDDPQWFILSFQVKIICEMISIIINVVQCPQNKLIVHKIKNKSSTSIIIMIQTTSAKFSACV